MDTLKQRLFTNWHLMRVIRLGLGIWVLVMAIQSKDWVMGIFSAFFIYTALAGVGCCGPQGCYVPDAKAAHTAKTCDAVYEEIK